MTAVVDSVLTSQTKLYSFKFNCKIVSFTAAKTKRMFSVSVAQVKCEYIILSVSGFKSTNILRMNSRAAWASCCGPKKERWLAEKIILDSFWLRVLRVDCRQQCHKVTQRGSVQNGAGVITLHYMIARVKGATKSFSVSPEDFI